MKVRAVAVAVGNGSTSLMIRVKRRVDDYQRRGNRLDIVLYDG